MFPINSLYSWKKKVVKDKEIALLIKTKKQNFNKVKQEIKELHSYEIPCILSIKPDTVDKNYSLWLRGK